MAKDDPKTSPVEAASGDPVGEAPGVQADGEVVVAFRFFDGTFEAALAEAKAKGKLVLVDVGAYWCHSCHELEENVFTLPKVGDRIREGFVAVKLDAEKDQGPELTERYRVQAYPTLLVLDANGVEMGRMVEVADAEELLDGLTKIAGGGDPLAALKEAAMTRLRPIVMTSLTTAAGAVPLILAHGAGAETRQAIGVVIVSGVLTGMLVTVLFVPTAYALIARGSGSPNDVARKLEAEEAETPDAASPQPAE